MCLPAIPFQRTRASTQDTLLERKKQERKIAFQKQEQSTQGRKRFHFSHKALLMQIEKYMLVIDRFETAVNMLLSPCHPLSQPLNTTESRKMAYLDTLGPDFGTGHEHVEPRQAIMVKASRI